MIRKTLITTSFMLSLMSNTQAEENKNDVIGVIDSDHKKCVESAKTTVETNNCTAKAANQYEEQMNTAYNRLQKSLKGEAKQNLSHSQAAWENYRAQESKFIGVFYPMDGTMYSTLRIHDHALLYKGRLEWLLKYNANEKMD